MTCNRDAHGCHHGDSSVLQFHGSAALEGSHISVGGKSDGVPEADGRLNTQLVLKCKPSRSLLDGKVSKGASSQAILQFQLGWQATFLHARQVSFCCTYDAFCDHDKLEKEHGSRKVLLDTQQTANSNTASSRPSSVVHETLCTCFHESYV